jgi:hypothetical protein
MKMNIFIPFNTRCCRIHFDNEGHIHEKEIPVVNNNVKLTGEQLSKLLNQIRERDAHSSTIFNEFSEINKTDPKFFWSRLINFNENNKLQRLLYSGQ